MKDTEFEREIIENQKEKNKIMKIKLTIEVELESIIDVTDEEQKLWLENIILVGDGTLNLHSEDIGDTVGVVRKVTNVQYLDKK